jgi:glycosyltransferase involved in cell wall biosynthesis
MKLRFAWFADAEDRDSYSAKEARILLPALAKRSDLLPLWFALGSSQPPHLWKNVRVFPVPRQCLKSASFLQTLIAQQQPGALLSNLPFSSLSTTIDALSGQKNVPWIHRMNPYDFEFPEAASPSTVLMGRETGCTDGPHRRFVPFIRGLDPTVSDGADPTEVLQAIEAVLADGQIPKAAENGVRQKPLIMRQHLFCNSSLATVMFELTNALLELGFNAVPEDEHDFFSREYIRREDDLYRSGAPEKYERVRKHLGQRYDPEDAVTIHFTLLRKATQIRLGVFPALSPREVFYTTGNHVTSKEALGSILERFQTVLAPSRFVLEPYLRAGLPRDRGAVIPHGIDPRDFAPGRPPFPYPTQKSFRFLQTSFPWVNEKGFDLTIKAFGRAFSDRDDVCLILRIPVVQDKESRSNSFGRLENLVKEEAARPGAPEILLLEEDIELNRRAGVYTGAHCYVHPLRAEGFGITILEAMACGLPVITTPWSGPADFISSRWAYPLRHSNPIPERGEDGKILRYHVEPELEHLIFLMRHVYGHYDEAQSIGLKAVQVAHREWTWQHAATKLGNLFSAPAPLTSGNDA